MAVLLMPGDTDCAFSADKFLTLMVVLFPVGVALGVVYCRNISSRLNLDALQMAPIGHGLTHQNDAAYDSDPLEGYVPSYIEYSGSHSDHQQSPPQWLTGLRMAPCS